MAASRAIPAIPMNPKSTIIDTISGIEPVSPPLNDLKINESRRNTAITAKSRDEIWPRMTDLAKSAIIIAYPPVVTLPGTVGVHCLISALTFLITWFSGDDSLTRICALVLSKFISCLKSPCSPLILYSSNSWAIASLEVGILSYSGSSGS